MRKILIVIVLVVASALLLTGCADMIKTPQEDEFIREWLSSIEDGEYAKHYYDVIGFGTEAEYIESMEKLDEYYNGDVVDMKKISAYVNMHTQNGQTIFSKELQYQIETTQDNYTIAVVFLSEDSEEYKLYSFSIVYSSELKGNGAVINFDDFDIVQLLLLILSVLSFGFMVFTIVLCAKSKVRLKGLWIPIIVIVQSGFTISRFPDSFSFNINFIATTISSLRKFLNGGTILTVMLPLGAILFVILRKTLIRRTQEYQERKALIEQLSEEQGSGDIEISMDELKDE